jgi:hypothetical protein
MLLALGAWFLLWQIEHIVRHDPTNESFILQDLGGAEHCPA